MPPSVEQIEDYYAELDCRGIAHASLTGDYLPAMYGRGERAVAASLGSFAYGNTPAELVDELLTLAEACDQDTFMDLGCGCGLPVLVAARRVRKAVGVDLLPRVLQVARRAARDLGVGNVEFREQDLCGAPLESSSIVFLAATRFESALLRSVEQRLVSLRPGTRLILVSKPLQGRQLRLKARITRKFSWGDVEPEQDYPVYIYDTSPGTLI